MHRKPPRRRNLWLALILNLAAIAGYLAWRWSDIMTVGWFAPWPEAVAAALGTVVCFSAALASATTLLSGRLAPRRPGPLRRAAEYIDAIRVEPSANQTSPSTPWPVTLTPEQEAEARRIVEDASAVEVTDILAARGELDADYLCALQDCSPSAACSTSCRPNDLTAVTEPKLLTHGPLYGGYVNIPDDGRANTYHKAHNYFAQQMNKNGILAHEIAAARLRAYDAPMDI